MTILSTFDNTADDSDKSFVVPDGRQWRIHWLHTRLITTATVGNRQFGISILDDSSNVVLDLHSAAVQIASLTRHYECMQGVFREGSFSADAIHVPLPIDLILLPGWTLRVFDENAIDAAADDMTVSFQYEETVPRIEL